MRLISLAALAAGFIALTACKSDDTDTQDTNPTDTNPTVVQPSPCDDDPNGFDCVCDPDEPGFNAQVCLDTYCDDTAVDIDTGIGRCPVGPLVYTSFKAAPGTTYLAGAYTGGETFGFYEFNGQPALGGTPDFADDFPLCEYTWTASNAATTPNATPCAECVWDARVGLSAGVLTGENPSNIPDAANSDYSCLAFGIDETYSDGLDFGYGYNAAYNYQGTDYPALMFLDDDTAAWGAVTLEGVTYDDVSGAFTYNWITQVGYLGL